LIDDLGECNDIGHLIVEKAIGKIASGPCSSKHDREFQKTKRDDCDHFDGHHHHHRLSLAFLSSEVAGVETKLFFPVINLRRAQSK
jgi:hypothetical protein